MGFFCLCHGLNIFLMRTVRTDNFDEVCFQETKVTDETVYAKEWTIQCAVTKKAYTLLESCVADDGIRNERLECNSVEDNKVVQYQTIAILPFHQKHLFVVFVTVHHENVLLFF